LTPLGYALRRPVRFKKVICTPILRHPSIAFSELLLRELYLVAIALPALGHCVIKAVLVVNDSYRRRRKKLELSVRIVVSQVA
jgi:hypothetical protein